MDRRQARSVARCSRGPAEGLAPPAGEFDLAIGGVAVLPKDICRAGSAACCVGLNKLVFGVPSDLRNLSAPATAAVQGISTPGSPSSSWVGSAEHGPADPGDSRTADRRNGRVRRIEATPGEIATLAGNQGY